MLLNRRTELIVLLLKRVHTLLQRLEQELLPHTRALRMLSVPLPPLHLLLLCHIPRRARIRPPATAAAHIRRRFPAATAAAAATATAGPHVHPV